MDYSRYSDDCSICEKETVVITEPVVTDRDENGDVAAEQGGIRARISDDTVELEMFHDVIGSDNVSSIYINKDRVDEIVSFLQRFIGE